MKLFSFVCLALALAAPGVAQDGSVESKIIAIEKAWNQAYKLRDKKALGEILHASIVLVNIDGSQESKNAFLASIESAKPSEQQQMEPESVSVHVFDNVAIATGVFREEGMAKGKAYVRRRRFVDTWVNHNGSWLCVAASATPMPH
jgi:ketosteroid isomerase-like protein